MAENTAKRIRIEGAGEFGVSPTRKLSLFYRAGVLLAFWLLLSGHFDAFHIGMGVVSVAIVLFLNTRIQHLQLVEEDDLPEWGDVRLQRLLFFIPWLVWQIALSSFQVAWLVLSPSQTADTSILRFKSRLPNMRAQVLFGHAITLMPGTVTIEINGDEFLVHALGDPFFEGVVDGSIAGEVAKVFGVSPENLIENVRIDRGEGA
jgi:multicomponent Na+:H+ antiporter subunit E